MRKIYLLAITLCFLSSSVFASITAFDSCRTEGDDRADDNRHDSSKLSIRATAKGNKSWIKFDLAGVDVSNVRTAMLTVALHEEKLGEQNFDVSYVNDNCLDNFDWTQNTLTWNNAPGNRTDDYGALDTTKTTYLSTVNFTDAAVGTAFEIDVLPAILSDTDGVVQFVLHNSSGYMNLSTHDHDVVEQRPVLDIVEAPLGADYPNPEDGASVETSLATLSWTNPDPNIPGTAITCDVYLRRDLGTEPNRPEMDMVPLGADISSVEINTENFPSLVTGLENNVTYYWVVDCHDPSRGLPPDDLIPGVMWSFYTDDNQLPTVSAGEDQVAWLGMSGTADQEVVTLNGVTSDDGMPNPPGTYTVQWTQVVNDAPEVTISPDDVDVTTVTITARGVYEFMLSANDGSAEDATDNVVVVIGDDACDASHLDTGDDYNEADENEDCLVDLLDLVTLITDDWLNCTDNLTNCD